MVVGFGIDPLHFGILMVANLCIGLCTPPVGTVLFAGAGISKVSVQAIIRPLAPLYIAMLVALILNHFRSTNNTACSPTIWLLVCT